MRACAIYYPYIQVPQNAWFTRILLYWDEVGAIVPYEYIEDPQRLGTYMVGLVKEQLVKQIHPGMYLWKAGNFERSFLDYIDRIDISSRKGPMASWTPVHMEKLQGIGDELCRRGLAKKSQEYAWYDLELITANEFMSYLAAVLGQLTDHDKLYPITDNRMGLNPFLAANTQDDGSHLTRKIILEKILPAPTAAVEPARLADFKGKYGRLLGKFRQEIEDKVSELSAVENSVLRLNRTEHIIGNMEESIKEIAARIEEERGWPKVTFGDFCTILGSGVSGYKAVIDKDFTFGVTAALLSLAPAVYNAFKGSEDQFEERPLAYAAYVQRRLRV